MAIKKIKAQGAYTKISQRITKDPNLSFAERGLLVTLLSLGDDWQFNIDGLSTTVPDGTTSISTILNKLIEKGYVVKVQIRGKKGQFGKNDLEVYEIPVGSAEANGRTNDKTTESQKTSEVEPCTEEPATVDSKTDYPTSEIIPQAINNKSINNKSINQKVCDDTLTDHEYEKLISEFGKNAVDYHINRIISHGYKGCCNYSTLKAWCMERANKFSPKNIVTPKNNSFCNILHRPNEDISELERLLLEN